MVKEKTPNGTRTFEVLNGINFPGTPPTWACGHEEHGQQTGETCPGGRKRPTERRLEVGEEISEGELGRFAAGLLEHGDIREKA